MRVRSILERHGWRATHGPYYNDPIEAKPRELDVSATKSWNAKRGITTNLVLLIECKSAATAAQLFAEQSSRVVADPLYYHWLAIDEDRPRNAIGNIVANANVMARFHAAAYPRERAIVMPLLVNAQKAKHRASASRQASGKEGGALWDATQKVFAALYGTIITEFELALKQIEEDLKASDSPAFAEKVLAQAIQNLILFHPIVSIESPLVLVDESGKTTDVEWCRIERARVFGVERQWIDIVNAEHFDSFASQLTSWYERVLSSK